MTCNNRLCVYEEESTCLLSEISISPMGTCEDCIIINLSQEMIQKEKLRLRQLYDEDVITS